MVIQNKSKKIKFIASISLLVLMIAAYNVCRIPTATNAESYGTSFSVEDSTYLNVSIPESVILNVTPTAAGQFAKTSMEISVDTNNTTGYTLTMTADTTSLSRTSAVNGIDYSIPTLEQAYTCTDESATTCDNFPVGYWGYKFTNAETTDSNTYSPMSTTANPIRFLKEFKNTTDTTTVTFGTKLSNSIPNGTYDGVSLTFIATTNYVVPETAKYMQDFNAVIADSLTPGITYTTKDSRDNQDYTVAKLADGNVWMTKNLNLAGGTAVTPADTDVTSNYVLPANSTTGPTGFSKVANSGSTICFNGTEILPCYSYYDIYTATAGTGPAADAPSSICPSGWKLPTIGQVDSLRQKYSRAEMFSEPVSFLASAAYNSGPNRDMFDNDINTYPESCIWTRQGITNLWTRGNQNSFMISDADSASQGNAVRCIFSGE